MADIYDGMKEHGNKPQPTKAFYETLPSLSSKIETPICNVEVDDTDNDIIVYESRLGWINPKL